MPCWICGGTEHDLVQPSGLDEPLASDDFRITSADYGRTAAIHRCRSCGFRACLEVGPVLEHYEGLEDPEYEATRRERALQADALLDLVERRMGPGEPGRRLLDVGAGSGITVERALARGWDAVGIEPSAWLCEQARARGLPVHRGVLPSAAIEGPFDAVTVVDVVEHVTDPVGLLRDVRRQLDDSGLAFIVTPDVSSVLARILGRRWWHYRVAHVGYFDRRTLTMAAERAGLRVVRFDRPGWHFRLDYLVPRLHSYLPRFLRVPLPRALGGVVVPLNLFDSLLAVATSDEEADR